MLGTNLEEKYFKTQKTPEYVTSDHPDHNINLYYESLMNTNNK